MTTNKKLYPLSVLPLKEKQPAIYNIASFIAHLAAFILVSFLMLFGICNSELHCIGFAIHILDYKTISQSFLIANLEEWLRFLRLQKQINGYFDKSLFDSNRPNGISVYLSRMNLKNIIAGIVVIFYLGLLGY